MYCSSNYFIHNQTKRIGEIEKTLPDTEVAGGRVMNNELQGVKSEIALLERLLRIHADEWETKREAPFAANKKFIYYRVYPLQGVKS